MNINRVMDGVSSMLKNHVNENNSTIEVSVSQLQNNEEFYHSIKDNKRIGEGRIGEFEGTEAYGVSVSDIYDGAVTESELTVKLFEGLQSVALKVVEGVIDPILNVLYSEDVENGLLNVYVGATNN